MKQLPQPVFTVLPETDCLKLVENYIYTENSILLTIPHGFTWDGASIPRALWTAIGSPYDPDYTLPALIHDYMYYIGIYAKSKADDIFLIELKREGVGYYTRYKLYWAVRWFGGKAWDEHRKHDLDR